MYYYYPLSMFTNLFWPVHAAYDRCVLMACQKSSTKKAKTEQTLEATSSVENVCLKTAAAQIHA